MINKLCELGNLQSFFILCNLFIFNAYNVVLLTFLKFCNMISIIAYAIIAAFSFSIGVHFFFTQKGEPTAKEKTIFLLNFVGVFAIGLSFGVSWGGYSAEQKCKRQKAEPANKKQALQDSLDIIKLQDEIKYLNTIR